MPPLKTLKKFKVCRCRHCGQAQVSSSDKMLVCKYCNKRSSFRLHSDWHIKIFFQTDNPVEASNYVMAMKNTREYQDNLNNFMKK